MADVGAPRPAEEIKKAAKDIAAALDEIEHETRGASSSPTTKVIASSALMIFCQGIA